jgi:hypothetical protein
MAYMDVGIQCGICCVDRDLGDMAFLDFCSCMHCKECTQGYIYSQLDDNQMDIICMNPDCSLPISDGDVRALLDSEYQEKYNVLNLRSALLNFDEYKMCPKDGCPGVIELVGNSRSVCIICKYEGCFKCFSQLHPEMTCESYSKYLADLDPATDNYQYEKWKIGKQIKTCPKCNWVIHKTGGCNRMICRKCGIYFCWICKTTLPKEASYDHFEQSECSLERTETLEHPDILRKPTNVKITNLDEVDDISEDDDNDINHEYISSSEEGDSESGSEYWEDIPDDKSINQVKDNNLVDDIIITKPNDGPDLFNPTNKDNEDSDDEIINKDIVDLLVANYTDRSPKYKRSRLRRLTVL